MALRVLWDRVKGSGPKFQSNRELVEVLAVWFLAFAKDLVISLTLWGAAALFG